MKRFLFITVSFSKLIAVLISVVLVLITVIGLDVYKNFSTVSGNISYRPTIIIDAGHGGEDGGTASSDNILEKDINLSISKILNDIFQKNGYRTVMIRTEDTLIYDESCSTIRQKKSSDLHNRSDIANKTKDSILISIHQNYYTESKYYGAQVFYSGNNPESEILAQSIQDYIKDKLQPENTRQIKKSGSEIFLLNNAVNPAVMVECGFMSNENEAKLLNTKEYQLKIADCIFNATDKFITSRK